jgi:AcrR family transcriptional regulator
MTPKKKIVSVPADRRTRRMQVMDAAIEVLAKEGARGLTYRAIDRHVGSPEGTTSNHFERRIEILCAVASQLFEADVSKLRKALRKKDDGPTTPKWVAERLAALWSQWPRNWVIARYEIFLEAARHPALLKIQTAWGSEVQEIWNDVFRRLGARNLQRSAFPWVDIIRGLLVSQVMLSERTMPLGEMASLLQDEIECLLERG